MIFIRLRFCIDLSRLLFEKTISSTLCFSFHLATKHRFDRENSWCFTSVLSSHECWNETRKIPDRVDRVDENIFSCSDSFAIDLLGAEVRWLIGRHKIVSTRLAIGLPIFGIDEPVSILLYPSRWPQTKVIAFSLRSVPTQPTHLGHNCRVKIKHPKSNELLLTHMRSGLNQAIQFYNNLSSDEQENQ